jgi:tetratricopeptide (TPR) repeat protein
MQPDTSAESFNFDNFLTWLYENRKAVGIITAAVVVVIAGISLYNWKKDNDEAKANEALFALPSLVTASGKTAQVRPEAFEKIASEYPDTQAADRAELIGAGILFTDGKYVEAQRAFSKFLESHEEKNDLQSQAALGVAASLEAQGKINEAITKYQEVISKYPGENIISPAKLTLARLLETQNKPADALKLYDDLTRIPNPYDPWAAEAGERREQLLQKNPALKKVAPPTSNVPPTNMILSPKPAVPPAVKAPVKK